MVYSVKKAAPTLMFIILLQCPPTSLYFLFSYELVKRIDSQLNSMGHDLKDVIEQMNAEGMQEEDSEVKVLVLKSYTPLSFSLTFSLYPLFFSSSLKFSNFSVLLSLLLNLPS